MKISVQTNELRNAMRKVVKSKPTRTTIDILNSTLVQAKKDGTIVLTCGDTNRITTSTTINGTVDEDFKVCLDTDLFNNYIGKVADDTTIIEVKDTIATIKCGKSKIQFSLKNADEYPTRENQTFTTTINVGQKLRDMVSRIIFAVAPNDNNKLMGAVNVVGKDNKLTLTALDGHRIAIATTDLECPDFTVNIEGDVLNKALSSLDGDVTLKCNSTFVELTDGVTSATTQLIAGEYFKVAQMIAGNNDKSFTVNKNEFRGAIDRASILITEGDRKPIVFTKADNTVKLSVKTFLGETAEVIDAKTVGDDLMIGFNPKFLQDVIKVVDDDEITIEMTGSKQPAIIHANGGKNTYLILPVNFSA